MIKNLEKVTLSWIIHEDFDSNHNYLYRREIDLLQEKSGSKMLSQKQDVTLQAPKMEPMNAKNKVFSLEKTNTYRLKREHGPTNIFISTQWSWF